MARRGQHRQHENHERWLVSYADFITLLFAFFVVMFAAGQTDKAKAQQVSSAVKEAFEDGRLAQAMLTLMNGNVQLKRRDKPKQGEGGPAYFPAGSTDGAYAELVPSLKLLSGLLEEEIRTGKVEVNLQARGLVVSLKQAAFFPSGEDRLAESSLPSVAKVAEAIRPLPNPLRLEGHTDAVPISTARFRSNWELSSARAVTMVHLLAEQFQIPYPRMAVAGYADTIPVADNDSLEGRARNRRVDIVILNINGLKQEPAKPGAAHPAPPAGNAAPLPNK